MPETYISLEDAASFEGVVYRTMQSRVQRNPKAFKSKEEPRENGGKPRVLVAVSSLSAPARRVYRASRKSNELQGDDILTEKLETTHPPWYVTADHHWYMENYAKQYAKAQELADILREFNDYCGDDRTGFSEQFAAEHGMTQRTLYRMSEKYLEASSWALQYERLTGASYDFFKVMALSRKPKESGTFPSIDGEVKALIENIWFDEKFRRNLGTIQMLYDKLSEKCAKSDVPFPSYQTVARYIGHLTDKLNGESATFLAERGLREWKNKFMLKGERDVTQLEVMEIVMGDEHTFDLFVSYTPPNGRRIAIRPTIIAWMNRVAQRLSESLEKTKLILDRLEKNPELDAAKAAQVLMTDGLMQRISTADGDFFEMPIEKAGRLLAELRRVDIAEKKLSFEMRKKIDLAFDEMEASIVHEINYDPVLSVQFREILAKAKEKMMSDE